MPQPSSYNYKLYFFYLNPSNFKRYLVLNAKMHAREIWKRKMDLVCVYAHTCVCAHVRICACTHSLPFFHNILLNVMLKWRLNSQWTPSEIHSTHIWHSTVIAQKFVWPHSVIQSYDFKMEILSSKQNPHQNLQNPKKTKKNNKNQATTKNKTLKWPHKSFCNKFLSKSNLKQRVQNEAEVRRRMKLRYLNSLIYLPIYAKTCFMC